MVSSKQIGQEATRQRSHQPNPQLSEMTSLGERKSVDGLSEMVRSDCGLPQEAFPGKCRARTRSAPLEQLNPNASL